MLMNTWERYFLKELIKIFSLVIICFYGIYVIIDFTSHSNAFNTPQTRFWLKDLCFYYCCEFVKRADILVPFALLIANVRTLCVLNLNNELIALQAAGIHIKRLIRPFILVGLFLTALLYINDEFILPKVYQHNQLLENNHLLKKSRKKGLSTVQNLILGDGSTLLYYSYNEEIGAFEEVYWIKSFNDLYHFKKLELKGAIPKGYFVDHLVRDPVEHGLHVKESFEFLELSEMVINAKTLRDTILLPEEQSLSNLFRDMPSRHLPISDRQASAITIFYQKLIKPWLCLLVILAPAPFCLKVTRTLPVFYIYATSIFAFVAFNLALDAAVVVGGRQALSPELSIFSIVFLFFLPVGINHMLYTNKFKDWHLGGVKTPVNQR